METWLLVKFLSPVQIHKHLQEIICTAVDIISSAVQVSPFLQSVLSLGSAASLTGCISHFSRKLSLQLRDFKFLLLGFSCNQKFVCCLENLSSQLLPDPLCSLVKISNKVFVMFCGNNGTGCTGSKCQRKKCKG